MENFQDGTTPTPSVPPRALQSPEKARSADSSFFRTLQHHDNNAIVRLTAKSVCSVYYINFLCIYLENLKYRKNIFNVLKLLQF